MDDLYCEAHRDPALDPSDNEDPGSDCADCQALRREAVLDIARGLAGETFKAWSQSVTKGMDEVAAATWLAGVEVGLHMMMQDEGAGTMAMLLMDFGAHGGETVAHRTAREAVLMLRLLAAGKIEQSDMIVNGIRQMIAEAPDPGDPRLN